MKIVVITEPTAISIDLTLLNCLKWLDTDAKFAHPNAEIRKLRNEIITTRKKFLNDSKEQKERLSPKPEGSESPA